MTTIRSTHQATASPGSDALTPPGSAGQVSNRQAAPLLRRRDDLHVAYWYVRTLQDAGVQALTMRELWKYNVDIAYLSEVRIPDSGHSVIRGPGEEVCYHHYHRRVVDSTGRHGMAWQSLSARQHKLHS